MKPKLYACIKRKHAFHVLKNMLTVIFTFQKSSSLKFICSKLKKGTIVVLRRLQFSYIHVDITGISKFLTTESIQVTVASINKSSGWQLPFL